MAKALICCYSGTGNTRLACRYIAAGLARAETTLFDVTRGQIPEPGRYDIVGLACFTDYWNPSKLMLDFIAWLPQQQTKPAFVFCTFGFTPGRTLATLARAAADRGFVVVAAHALHTPENYPPVIVRGRTAEDSPNARELAAFNLFISDLDRLVAAGPARAAANGSIKVRAGLIPNLVRFPRTKSRSEMGEKYVDGERCTECGLCQKRCPYGAIGLEPKPVFDEKKCYGCWACYNLCPAKAIHTRKLRDRGHYPRPLPQLVAKLSAGTRESSQ